ncbi:MAG: hypothetical protein ACYS6W_13790 [Planctomycetota bacterium]|jgi:hypothetical protein
MRYPGNIERSIKKSYIENIEVSADAEMDGRIIGDALAAMEESKKTSPAFSRPNIWRIIMKSPITKLAAAAVIIVTAVLSITILEKSATPAYGITDLPELLKKARTIHVKGWVYFPNRQVYGQDPAKVEYWFDVENGRYRLYKPGRIDRDTGERRYYTTVSDGRYVMKGNPWKSISFTKLSPFKARLEAYKNSYAVLMRMFGNIDQIKGSAKVGQEKIEGTVFDIWENEYYFSDGRGIKIRTWVAPDSGDVERILFWEKRQKDDPNWRLGLDFHTIELNVLIPQGIFNTEPPKGYKLDNTKETALLSGVGISPEKVMRQDYELHRHIGFTLSDGSVIIGWSCPEKSRSSQSDLFKGLTPGGRLPEFAAKIESLTAIPQKLGISYKGHHLAYTQKDRIFYEWSLYVPDSEPPTRGSLLAYELNVKYEVDKNRFGTRPGNLSDDLVIDSSDDFDTWVLGAMAELSDNGKAPEQVTYGDVLQLAKQIRN